MVFFTCNNCGESVKKPAVEKHYNSKCRNNPIKVSCMDCNKDFYGEEYVAHTKCISEVEKYSGKNFVLKEKKNSGQKKQETWTETVRSILESTDYQLSTQTRNIFQRLQNYENVPRKKSKFQNFVVNCLRISTKDAKPVWEVLEKELETIKNIRQQELEKFKKDKENEIQQKTDSKRKLEENRVQEEEVQKKKSKKEPVANECKENGAVPSIEDTEAFEWITVLEKFVAKHPEGLSLDKLQKKVLKKYKTKLNIEEITEKQQKKFEKKFSKSLKKCPTVQVDGDLAKPC